MFLFSSRLALQRKPALLLVLLSLVLVLPPVHAQEAQQQCTFCDGHGGGCYGDYDPRYLASSPQEAITKWFAIQYSNYPLLSCSKNGQLVPMLPTRKWWTTGVTTTTQGRRGQYRYYEIGHSGLYYGDVINNVNSACVYREEIYVDRGGTEIPKVQCFEPLSSTISVSGKSETRPAATGGTSTIELTAKVTQSGSPKAGVAVSFSVDVTANSGGHEHHDANRPKGSLSGTQGTTDANGEVKLIFTAPEVAGIHTVKANCSNCANSPAVKEIQVKVPGLVEMKPDTGSPASYLLVGSTQTHTSNHWFTPGSVATLHKVADAMFKTDWGAVGVNDGSLAWGGLFDIKGGWSPSHHEHRMGTEVDLSVTNPRKATDEQKKKTYRELCRKDNTAFSIQTLWHQDDGYPEHFHMYLDGTGLTSQAGGGPCCTRYKTTRAKKDKNGNPVLKNGQPVQETVALCEETSPR